MLVGGILDGESIGKPCDCCMLSWSGWLWAMADGV